MPDDERDVEHLIAERQAANPRHAPGREPAGARHTRHLIGVTGAILVVVTLVLIAVLVLGG